MQLNKRIPPKSIRKVESPKVVRFRFIKDSNEEIPEENDGVSFITEREEKVYLWSRIPLIITLEHPSFPIHVEVKKFIDCLDERKVIERFNDKKLNQANDFFKKCIMDDSGLNHILPYRVEKETFKDNNEAVTSLLIDVFFKEKSSSQCSKEIDRILNYHKEKETKRNNTYFFGFKPEKLDELLVSFFSKPLGFLLLLFLMIFLTSYTDSYVMSIIRVTMSPIVMARKIFIIIFRTSLEILTQIISTWPFNVIFDGILQLLWELFLYILGWLLDFIFYCIS